MRWHLAWFCPVYVPVWRKWIHLSFRILSHLLAFPIFILIHNYLPNPGWKYPIDRIILFLIILGLVEWMYRSYKKWLLWACLLYLGVLTFGSLTHGYGFSQLIRDYRFLIYHYNRTPEVHHLVSARLKPFHQKEKVLRAIDYQKPSVRQFAVLAATKHFADLSYPRENRVLVHSLAVFKEINTHWKYIHDPKSRDYFAPASESVMLLAGDCDDHSILMAAAIHAIGGSARLVHTEGHMYPELRLGPIAELDNIHQLIREKLFPKETEGKELNYHTDENGDVWINLDYTANYPGGPYKADEILGILQPE